MALTKNMTVMKVLVEESLRRHQAASDRTAEEVALSVGILKLMPPKGRIFLFADAKRFAEDFAHVMGRSFYHIVDPQELWSLDFDTVVQLHTGSRTIKQTELNAELTHELKQAHPDAMVWHIGEWRAEHIPENFRTARQLAQQIGLL